MSFEKEIIETEFRTVSSSKTLKEIEALSNAILKLKRDTEALEKQKKAAAVQYGANSKEVKELTAQIKANNAQLALQKSKLEDANKKLKLSEMSSGQLKKRMSELKKAMEGVNKEAFPDRWNKLNKAYKDTETQLDKVTNGSNAVKKGVGSIMTYAKGLLPAFGFSAIAGGILSLSKELFQLSIQMKSDNIRNATIFGNTLSYVEKEAARLSKTMGLTKREFVANAASSADLLKPLGFTSEQAAKLAVRMQELAGPLAEWSKGKYNAAQITEVMNGALTGEMERLKGLGIIIQQSSPEYLNMINLKQKEEGCTLDQAKALAALELMYQKSADAQNAFAAGGNNLQRNWENLKATWRRAKEWIVELFDDSVTSGLEKQQNYVNALAVQLTNTNTSSAERVRILNQLKSISPDIVSGLNAENLEMGKLRENLDKYNGSMLERITLTKLNADVEKKRDKAAEADVTLGDIGLNLSNQMIKINPEIAQENISVDEKMQKLEDWRNTNVSFFNISKKNEFAVLKMRYQDYQNQQEKVKKLQEDYENSLKEIETKKEMMVFSSAGAETAPVTSLSRKGSDIDKKTAPAAKFTDDEQKNQKTALSRSGTVEQASEDYKKQLTDAGLFGRKREELTGESLRALEAIEKTYRDNLAKLDTETITKYLDQQKSANERELSDLQIKQNTELAAVRNLGDARRILSQSLSADELGNIRTMEQAKKALADKNNREERETTKRQAGELSRIITDIQGKKQVKGLKLADAVISPAESKLLQGRMQAAQDALAKIAATEAQFSVELVTAREKAYAEATQSAMTETEKENQAYAERLTSCGLFGKKREELSGEALLTLEALEKAHRKKLNEIDRNAIVSFVGKKQAAYSQELSAQKTKQNQEYASLKTFRQIKEKLAQNMSSSELAGINTLGEARQALQAQYDKANRKTLSRQSAELLGILQTAMDGKDIPDLKLSDHILSEEESRELQQRIAEVQAASAGLGKEDVDLSPENQKESGVDILGMSPEGWQTLFDNLANGRIGLEDLQDVAASAMQMWGTANEFMTARENANLREFENNSKKKKTELARQLDSGAITQEQYTAKVAQLDAELDAKKEEISQKQAKREKRMAITNVIINTALAISKTASTLGFPFAIPFIAAVAALGAVQLATIVAQPDEFKKGGFTSGAASDNKEAGIVHANEFVASADAVRNPSVLPVLQMIDQAQRDGSIRTLDLAALDRQNGFRSGGFTSPAAPGAALLPVVSGEPEIKALLLKNIETMQILASKKIEIPWYGRGGLDEKMQKAGKYEKEIRP